MRARLASRPVLAFLVAAVVAVSARPAVAELSAADLVAVDRVTARLNEVETLRARFIQIGPHGELSRGELYLRRPGRLRFEYAPPSPLLLVGDGIWLVMYDRELEQVNRWPIYKTPLGVLVAETIDLNRRTTVTEVRRDTGTIRLTLVDRENPDEGSVTLVFTEPPLMLRKWVIVDAQGGITNVSLQDTRINVPLDPELFFFEGPTDAPSGGGN